LFVHEFGFCTVTTDENTGKNCRKIILVKTIFAAFMGKEFFDPRYL
jgi:hypothetical protein